MTTAPTALLEQHRAKKSQPLDLGLLRGDGPAQLRVARDAETVAGYAAAYREGHELPPIVVFHEEDGDQYHLADGHHRVAAAKKAGLAEIDAIVKTGTRRDAILYAAGANGRHGLPLTLADKERIVCTLLADEEWRGWSDREIGRHCCCSHAFVGKLRKREGAASATRKGKDGRTRPVPAAKEEVEPEPDVRNDAADNGCSHYVRVLAEEIHSRVPDYVHDESQERIMAALLLAWRGLLGDAESLSTKDLEELTGGPLIRPGQLVSEGLIHGTAEVGYTISEDAHHDLFPCLAALDLGGGAPPEARKLAAPEPSAPALLPARGRICYDAADDSDPKIILGVGDTDAMARADAERNAHDELKDPQFLPATGTLLAAVEETGGDLPWFLREDGIADVDPGWSVPDKDRAPAPARELRAGIAIQPLPLAERRAAWIRQELAGRIENAHSFHGTDAEWHALLLLVGMDTRHVEHWEEPFVQGAVALAHRRLAECCASELMGSAPGRLPDWTVLARLWGQDASSIRVLADRSIPE